MITVRPAARDWRTVIQAWGRQGNDPLTVSFSPGFWSFTFPPANMALFALRWLQLEHRPAAARTPGYSSQRSRCSSARSRRARSSLPHAVSCSLPPAAGPRDTANY